MKHTRLPRYLALILALVAMLVPFVAFAQESNPTGPDVLPDLVYGNPTCASLNADNANFPEITSNFGFKINLAPNGKFVFQTVGTGFELTGSAPTDLTNSVTIFNSNGIKFDWLATLGIDAVIVKAQDANAYVYAPEALTDNGLVAPGTNKEISHIEFCYDYELTATKTANATYTRTFTWGIVKSVDVDNHSGFPGDQFTSNYVVDVYQTVVDSDFAVSGEITVNNPTPFEVNFSVADSVGGIAAAVVCPTYSLAPGTGTTCTYSVDLGDTLPANGTNTATITSNTTDVGGASANADYTFGDPTNTDGDAEVNINDSVKGLLGPASGNQPFAYSHDFACSTNPADYTDGIDTDTYPNKATIAETGQSDSESVTVSCTLPALQVSKTAAGSYDRTVTWSLTKSVYPASHSGIVGGVAGSSIWTVEADKTVTLGNYRVIGTITIINPAPIAQTFTVVDVLNDGTEATVNCPKNTAGPGETVVCTYEVNPQNDAAALNTATVTAAGNLPQVDDAGVSFIQNPTIGNDSGTLSDPRFAGLPWTYAPEPISGHTTRTFEETFLCPADASLYDVDGKYTRVEPNTATLNVDIDHVASASVTVDCYAPVVTKDAIAGYDETHTWSIVKSVDPESPSGYPGDELDWTWTVNVSEDSVDSNFAVNGTILVYNPAPSPMTVDVSDTLGDGTVASVDCDAVTEGNQTSLKVAANSTGSCTYSAGPGDASATWNIATATIGGASFSGSTPVNFVKNVIGGTATVVDTQIGLNEDLTAGSGQPEFTRIDSHKCSSSAGDYGEDGVYGAKIDNSATVTASNKQSDSDDATTTYTCEAGFVDLLKLTNGADSAPEIWDFVLYEGPDGFGKTQVATDSTPPASIDFGKPALSPVKIYTLCELSVPAGWSSQWLKDGQIVTPYNPNANDEDPEDLGHRCFDFQVTVGNTTHFEIDNRAPGGDPRTPGYWKNWNTCTGGGQAANAERNGGWQEGFWLLDDVLNPPGITWDDIESDAKLVPVDSCEEAVEILDQRVVNVDGVVGDGKKIANDGARTLAMHLLAAQLNFGAGACTTPEVNAKALEAETLLDEYNFDGTNTKAYLTSKNADYSKALSLANYLDEYNNGMYCGSAKQTVAAGMPAADPAPSIFVFMPVVIGQ